MPEWLVRGSIALVASVVLGAALIALPPLRRLPPDLVLTGYAATVAVLGVYTVLGGQAAGVAFGVVGITCLLGTLVYVLVALGARWAERD